MTAQAAYMGSLSLDGQADVHLMGASLLLLAGSTYGSSAEEEDRELNCVTFSSKLLQGVFGRNFIPNSSIPALHITDHSNKWSNIQELSRLGVGMRVKGPVPGCWHLIQGWSGSRGHCFLWRHLNYNHDHKGDELGLVVEATNANRPWARLERWFSKTSKYKEIRISLLRTELLI